MRGYFSKDLLFSGEGARLCLPSCRITADSPWTSRWSSTSSCVNRHARVHTRILIIIWPLFLHQFFFGWSKTLHCLKYIFREGLFFCSISLNLLICLFLFFYFSLISHVFLVSHCRFLFDAESFFFYYWSTKY